MLGRFFGKAPNASGSELENIVERTSKKAAAQRANTDVQVAFRLYQRTLQDLQTNHTAYVNLAASMTKNENTKQKVVKIYQSILEDASTIAKERQELLNKIIRYNPKEAQRATELTNADVRDFSHKIPATMREKFLRNYRLNLALMPKANAPRNEGIESLQGRLNALRYGGKRKTRRSSTRRPLTRRRRA